VKLLPILIALASAPLAAADYPKQKPGLWEIEIAHEGALADMQKQANQQMQAAMASMSPEQRQKMAQMLAAQGVQLPGAGPQKHRICLTPAQAQREFDARPDPEADCKQTLTRVSASEARFTLACQTEEGRMTGEGRVWDMSPTGYRMKMSMKLQGGQGPVRGDMEMSHVGRWLGADCKGVAPLPD
jgi:hypothetical protein